LVKLAPDIADEDIPPIVTVLISHRVDGIIVSNTTLARDNLVSRLHTGESGGLSGKPLFERSTRLLAKVYVLTEGRIPLVGVGGIDSAHAALSKIEAGASLLQLYTGLVYYGPALIERIKRRLCQEIDRAGANNIEEIVGRRAEDWAHTGGK
jgi:dihydroorotate dehydrogenase